ncbi:NUDIX hydrolase [Streptomyces sp. NPDC003090]|uniref:NUDIX hydrolase n=1 Tax=Streptomyces sp. NPDC003090 TaxID=3154274 RepID=UPI0037FF036F
MTGGARGGRDGADGRPGVVRAAGCVLWRPAPAAHPRPAPAAQQAAPPGAHPGPPPAAGAASAGVELCLIHRPKYDDWSFPKGKLKPGEDPLAAAVREVREETGHTCRPGAHLGTVRYRARGRQKEVDYWSAEAGPGAFTPGKEVDAVRWLPPEEARELLSHPQDRTLVSWFLAAL